MVGNTDAEALARQAVEQGHPPTITDDHALRLVASLLREVARSGKAA